MYPIKKKNYNVDPYAADNWKAVINVLRRAYSVTIFGYSTPKTDVEVIDILKKAWGVSDERNMEDFELIDVREKDELIECWCYFVHIHHCSYSKSFFQSALGRFPRRSIEELFDRTQNYIWMSPNTPLRGLVDQIRVDTACPYRAFRP